MKKVRRLFYLQVKETVEHNNRFYGEELKTESEQLKEWLIVANKEIERLNNKLKDIKSQLDYLETYSSKEDVFKDMKRRLDRIDKIIGSDNSE